MEVEMTSKVSSYLSFKIGNEEFGAPVDDVLSILEACEITKVPKAPAYLKGVINLRGIVLPVIDIRIKFGMTPTEFTDKTCILVLEMRTNDGIEHVGALVDSVEAVYDIDEQSIDPAPSIGNAYQSKFITGITRMDDCLIMILDLVKLFTQEEITEIGNKNNKTI